MSKINAAGVPDSLKIYKQWVCWKYVERVNEHGEVKTTKIPYNPTTNRAASAVDRFTWCTFNDAVAALDRYDGVGFVLTPQDPFCVMDLDKCDTDEDRAKFTNYYTRLNSFTEISPSGSGCHIWVQGSINKGRNKRPFELYSSQRFITVTGNVHYNTDIHYRQEVVDEIWKELAPAGGDLYTGYDGNDPAPAVDQVIIDRAAAAKNGYKFCKLWAGDYAEWYKSQSEADFALIDILAFYTQNTEQIARLFRFSALGKREKAQRDKYVLDTIARAYDKLPPKANIEALVADIAKMAEQFQKEQTSMASTLPTSEPVHVAAEMPRKALPSYVSADMATYIDTPIYFPKGLIGDVAEYIYRSSPRPVKEIALTAAIGLLAGIAGSAYNISSTGLNMYVLALAPTGTGKEAMSGGISRLMTNVRAISPSSDKFVGASQIASSQALLGYLGKYNRSQVSIIGECGLWLKEISDPHAPAHTAGLRRILLDLYGKSGRGSSVQPSIYADSAKNTDIIRQPAFSILGDSTPSRFYEIIDEQLITEGFVPRWLIIEYNGRRPQLNENHSSVLASSSLLQSMSALCDHAHRMMETLGVIDIAYANDEVYQEVKDFNVFCDAQINGTNEEAVRDLWTRAYLKALKLAGLAAVGRNFGTPAVNMDDWQFAKLIVLKDTIKMCTSFSSGTLAASLSSENLDQYNAAIRVLKSFVTAGQTPQSTDKSYSVTPSMRRDFVVPYSFFQRRLASQRAFAKSKMGSSKAIASALKDLEMAGIITALTPSQAASEYEYGGKVWCITGVAQLTLQTKSG